MQMADITAQMLVLFILVIMGYIARKTHIMDADFTKKFCRLVINIGIPAQILGSILSSTERLSNRALLTLMAASLVTFGLLIVIGLIAPKLIGIRGKYADAFSFMIMFSNVAFVGYPVVTATLGAQAVFYASLFNTPFNLLLYSIGISLLSQSDKKTKLDPRVLINPPFLTSLASIMIFLFNWPFPSMVVDATVMLGNITTPSAMLIIGSSLADVPIRSVFTDWRIYPLSFFRLLFCPFAVWLFLHRFISDAMTLNIAILMAAMPVATNATMLSMEYGADEAFASKGTFITTALSMLTIPLVVSLFLH
jgi:predicted permease